MHWSKDNKLILCISEKIFFTKNWVAIKKILFYKKRISEFQSKIEKRICSDLINVFWKRKQHVVDFSHDDNFNEKQISTKSRPIQMNDILEQHCHLKINDLESKSLIQKSRSF